MNLKKIFDYFFLIFWMGVIFYLSNQPDLKSGFETWLDFILRKIDHITEYAILTFLAWRVFSENGARKNAKYLFFAVIFSVLYAISDEYHQTFVRGRVGSSIDVLVDSVGVVIIALLIRKGEIKKQFF